MSSLAEKIVLITGAGSGIGQATAVKLDRLGARLALTDVSQDGLDKTLELIGGDKGQHYAHVLDVSKPDVVEGQVAAIAARFGRIDHVFNCAGINPTAMPLTDCTDEYYDRLMAVNMKGVFSVTKATMPHMTAPGGSYVNVSSIMGLHAGNGSAIYCATKWGLIGFSKSMALELGPKGVRVNVVAPGYIHTPTNAGVMLGTDAAIRNMEQANSLGRMGRPEEIADVVVFLMSAEAKYMNGSVVEVDGMLKSQ